MRRNRFGKRHRPHRGREDIKPSKLGIPSITLDVLGHRIRTGHNADGETEIHIYSEDTDITLSISKAGGIIRLYRAIKAAIQGEIKISKQERRRK